MRTIIIIGTLHEGLTPVDELQEILEDIHPDQLLVEITKEDLQDERFGKYPKEMVYAHKWAKKNNIQVNGFDSPIDVMKHNITKEDEKHAVSEIYKLLKDHTWKDMNKKEYQDIESRLIEELVDPLKHKKRQQEMLQNIKRSMLSQGKILILTGAGHLEFFEEHLPEATFPFRGNNI